MAAKEDGECASQEGDQRIVDLALQRPSSKGQNWSEKGGKGGRMEERIRGRRAAARKEEKGVKEIPEHGGLSVRQDTLHLHVEKEETQIYTLLTKMTVRTLKNRPNTKRICKHGACWKKARMNSGKK